MRMRLLGLFAIALIPHKVCGKFPSWKKNSQLSKQINNKKTFILVKNNIEANQYR